MILKLVFLSLSFMVAENHVKADDASNSDVISHDPFQKPIFIKSSVKSKTNKQANKLLWKPHLIMTLRAGKNSMANVGGQIVRLGENIEGYKLIKVYERAVEFVNQGKITRLTLDEDNAIQSNL